MPLFSFGYGHCCPNRWVRMDSRAAMVEVFSMYWGFEYDDNQYEIRRIEAHNMFEIGLAEAECAFILWRYKNVAELLKKVHSKMKFYIKETGQKPLLEFEKAKQELATALIELYWLNARAEKLALELPSPHTNIPLGALNDLQSTQHRG